MCYDEIGTICSNVHTIPGSIVNITIWEGLCDDHFKGK
jgi:hypothetical protein